jgi:MFS family permease
MLLGYWREFRLNWVTLVATFIGIGTGNALSHYTLSLFAPELIAEFGWSKAQFALLGTLQLVSLVTTPFAGRFADRFGVRIAASVGFFAISAGFAFFSMMQGSLIEFFIVWLLQHVFGVLTTSLVLTRAIVERFDRARGTSLSLLMTGPPLSGAIAAPLLGSLIASEGWRTAFVALAIVSALGGTMAVALMGRQKQHAPPRPSARRIGRGELLALARTRTFLLLVGGMFLINIPQVFAASQIKLVVMAGGVPDQLATWMVSFYAMGVIGGRTIFGIALDRIGAHIVALGALSLPVIGFLILATPGNVAWLVAAGVTIIGVAQGAEGDVGAYMVSRHFDHANYSLIFGFVKAALDGGGAIGALILSATLASTDGYAPFLFVSAATTMIGAICFYLTGPGPERPAETRAGTSTIEELD